MFAIAVISMFFINMSFAANTGKISVETANLRESANENSKILELISLNEEVEILENSNGWYQVKYKGIKGYLRQDLLTVNGETQAPVVEEQKNEEPKIEQEQPVKEEVQASQENQEQNNENAIPEKTPEEIQIGRYKLIEDTDLKIIPTINAYNIAKIKKDQEIKTTEIINGWICIEATEAKGWVRQEKLEKVDDVQEQNQEQTDGKEPEENNQTKEPEKEEQPVNTPQNVTKYINSGTVNLRREPNTTCEVITSLMINKEVVLISEENGWSKVKVDGMEGYVSSSLLSDTKQETSRGSDDIRRPEVNATPEVPSKVPPVSNANTTKPTVGGAAILATANQYLGAKYIYGGTTPSGFDCSGFTFYVYKQHGITLNRTAATQYSNGVAVNRNDLQQGDLVMFGKSGINHVGIYIGGGKMIHAANPSRGVTTDTINSGYYNINYVGARRVL